MASAKNGKLRERRFERLMGRRGIALVRPTQPFRFGLSTYRPDFYSPSEDRYYEVLGSRQRACSVLPLLDLLTLKYPAVRLDLVSPDGEPMTPPRVRSYRALAATPVGAALLDRMARERLRFGDVARAIGVSGSELSKFVTGRIGPEVKWFDRLAEFANG